MRGLSPTFMEALQHGILQPLLQRVLLDRTLDLEIRDDYVNIYYRGGNLLCLKATGGGYSASFDVSYAKGAPLDVPDSGVRTSEHALGWLDALPRLKLAMDLHRGHQAKEEREIQQIIVRDNNRSNVSRATDYYVCDIEYKSEFGQFDIIAVHWPSNGTIRKRQSGRRLIIGEVKQGDNALANKAGLHAHVRDVEAFLSEPTRVRDLKTSMVEVFNQKRCLGLIDCSRDLESFADEPPVFLLILANHDPDKTKLRGELMTLPPTSHCEILVATSSLVGYGLFDPGMRTVEEILALPETAL